MRVVHVGKYYPPEYEGGLEAVVHGINRELLRRGFAASVVVASARGPASVDNHDGVRVTRVKRVALLLSQPVCPGFAAAVHSEPGDLVHLHHPNPLADVAVRGEHRPLVVTHHSDVVRQRLLWPLYGPLVRGAFERARAITVGSQQLLRTSRELRGFEPKIRVIPFGIEAERFALTEAVRARAAELRSHWGDRPVVLAVGRLVRYKGFDVLLEAARGLEATVVVVGTGPEGARLRARATPNVVFAGRVSDQDLIAHYHACDVLTLPSVTIAEAFGMVLLEAMACGKPLVTTALPTGVSAVNRHGVTGLVVPPRDAGALRTALRELLASESRRREMGEAARAVQAAEYSAQLMGERFVELYNEIVARG
ncbi:MAG TPA: glycosyltransferase [Gemmatimonadales bacterium]|nr:glycosyltransferase [Gemmatimonadales bacterium]